MRVLVAGWFSFEKMGATAGDLMVRDLACRWLEQAGHPYDVAVAPPFAGGVDWGSVEPGDYTHVVFTCGPFGNGPPAAELLERFRHCRMIGLDLTMLEPLNVWNPFDLLLERDSSVDQRPDFSFLSTRPAVPVVGVVLIHPQPEYEERDLHEKANAAIERLLDARESARVRIDTRLDTNRTGLRTPAEVESVIRKMDVVLTTRLHGLVLAIKNGVPAVAIDPVAGGAKIKRQAESIDWPVIHVADRVSDRDLETSFDYCRSREARDRAARSRDHAIDRLSDVRRQFLEGL